MSGKSETQRASEYLRQEWKRLGGATPPIDLHKAVINTTVQFGRFKAANVDALIRGYIAREKQESSANPDSSATEGC
jgi:hypothetical protein